MMNILEVCIIYSSKLVETIIGWYNLFTRTGGPFEISQPVLHYIFPAVHRDSSHGLL
jgi:hypothetical protein